MVIVHHCFFLLCHPILGSFLNLLLSMFRAFQFCSNKFLDTSVCIHRLQQNSTVLLIVRFSADVSWWKHFCFLAYAFLMLSLFHVRLRFVFRWECLLTDLLSNCSIAWFITSWKSFMNSIRSALQLTSDELSLSSNSSWSLSWSGGGCFATSCDCTFPVWLLDSPVISCLSVDRHCRTCSHVFGEISSTTLSSITVSITSWTFCVSGAFPVGFPTVSVLPSDARDSSSVSCPQFPCWGEKAKFLLCKELFLTQTHTSKLKHIGRVILTHTLKEKLNKQSEKHKCIIRDTSVHPNTPPQWSVP